MDRFVSLWWRVSSILFISYCVHGSSQLMFGSPNTISILNMDNNDVQVIVKGVASPVWFDYHYRKGLVYWTDRSRIWRTRLSSINVTIDEVIGTTNGYVGGLAVDYVNDKLYWSSSNKILRSDLDGSNTKTILDTNLNYPNDIELDLEYKWMYIAVNSMNKIEKCKLDGSRRQSLTSGVSYPYTIALDLVAKRIYWINYHGKFEIKSALFNGSDVRVIDALGGSYGLDIYNNYLYISYQNEVLRVDKSTGDNKVTVYSGIQWIYDAKIFKENAYECSMYKLIQNEEKRSAGYQTDPSLDTYFNDEEIGEDWYRIISENGDEMPNYPPGSLQCGTYHPIWLNGTLPSTEDGNVTRETCVQTNYNICNLTIPIEIRNCGDFYVYHLQNTSSNSAYCFGNGPVLCPDGLSSETGYYPGCNSTYPNETVSVTVQAVLVDGPTNQVLSNTPSLIPVFRCVFVDMSNGMYAYDIYWYINGDTITNYINVKYADIKGTDLKHTDWIDDYKMNMEVKCAVRIRYQVGSIPGKFIESREFQAGFFPEKYEYSVVEGESFIISFTSTVPVGCSGSHADTRKHCYQTFYISQPKYANTTGCAKNRYIAFKSHFCGVKLGNLDWNETKQLHVYGISDGLYNYQDRITSIKLSTNSNQTDMWTDIRIPEIKVTVVDKDSVLTSRLCQSYNDPHITTFDGKVYHYMEVGEFVIYRNDRGPYWVHALFTNCGFGWKGSACHCGIAVRSRNSLFVLRTCKRISRTDKYLLDQPHTEIRSCDKRDFQIDHTGNNYKITLPIGTEIRFSMSSWDKFITSVSIKPAVYDINKAKGLCGVPNVEKDPGDDFTHRDLGPINDKQRFGDSWRITSSMWSEQLFVAEPHFLFENIVTDDDGAEEKSNATQTGYCICEKQAGHADDPDEFYNVQCNLTESTEHCSSKFEDNQSSEKPVGDFHTSCYDNDRRRRSVTHGHKIVRRSTTDSDDIVDFIPLEYDDDINDNETTTESSEFRNGWTEEKANETCYEKINKAIPAELFADASNLTNTEYIDSCILDIKLTASTDFLQDTVGAMQTYTVIEVSKNESLAVMKTENGSQTVLDYITSLLCPNNCNNNGNCTSGVCSCFDGYIGDDCSRKMSTPPSNISIPENGLCRSRTRACKRTNVLGVFLSTTIWCSLRHFKVVNNIKKYTMDAEIVKTDYRNSFMVSVDLAPLRKRRSPEVTTQAEGFEIRLSNDKQDFGDPADILIFDEKCQNCVQAPIKCVPLHDSCPLLSTTDTTTITQTFTASVIDVSETATPSSYRILIVIIVVITVFLTLFIAILVVWRIRNTKSRKSKEYKVNTRHSNKLNSYYGNPSKDKMKSGVQDSLRIPRLQTASTT